MVYKWFILLFPLLTAIIALTLYYRRGERMTRFYSAMVEKRTVRKFYVNAILFVLIAYHYIYTLVNIHEYGVFLSIVFIIGLYRFKTAEWLLQKFNKNDRNFRLIGLVALFMTVVISPHFLTLSATIIILLSASVLYPSERILQRYNSYEGVYGKEELYRYYFSLGTKNAQAKAQTEEEKKDKKQDNNI